MSHDTVLRFTAAAVLSAFVGIVLADSPSGPGQGDPPVSDTENQGAACVGDSNCQNTHTEVLELADGTFKCVLVKCGPQPQAVSFASCLQSSTATSPCCEERIPAGQAHPKCLGCEVWYCGSTTPNGGEASCDFGGEDCNTDGPRDDAGTVTFHVQCTQCPTGPPM